MDNASSLGAGGTVVAQNDQDLEAEWALSNFDRRHQVSADVLVGTAVRSQPPMVDQRRPAGGDRWRDGPAVNFTCSRDRRSPPGWSAPPATCMRGTSGSLRANYTGAPIRLSDPTVDEFFNTAAFAVPAAGTFGNSPRNIIVGPGSHQLNATFSRDLRIGGNRIVTLS